MCANRFSRRRFLRLMPVAAASIVVGHEAERRREPAPALAVEPVATPPVDEVAAEAAVQEQQRLLEKIRDFDRTYADDYCLVGERKALLGRVAARLASVRDFVGYGNFNLLGFEHLLRIASNYPAVGGGFPRAELDFLEEIFTADARRYGFRGEKVLTRITDVIPKDSVRKIAGTGHYLLRGAAASKYARIRADLGESVVLTSGVRGLAKQFELFLSKAVATGGNLSRASRSLAPPGYSYHAVGDFDIGKAGYGLGNFSEEFCKTEEYQRLVDLGYVAIRYTPTNPFGVRHEPWHVKVA